MALIGKSYSPITKRRFNFRSFLNKCCNVINSSRLVGHIGLSELHRHWFRRQFVTCSTSSHYLGKFLLMVDEACKPKFHWIWSNGWDAICSGQRCSTPVRFTEQALYINLHRLISAAIGRGWPLTQPNYHFSLGGKNCALTPLNIIPNFPKEKHKFLSDLSSKSSTFMCSICMIA